MHIELPEDHQDNYEMIDLPSKIKNMHHSVRDLIEENARLNFDNTVLTFKNKSSIIKACARYHDTFTTAYLAKHSKIFNEMSHDNGAVVITSLPMLKTLYEHGYDLTQDNRLKMHFFMHNNDISHFYLSKNTDALKNQDTASQLINGAVVMNITSVLERMVAHGMDTKLIKTRSFFAKAEKSSMDMLVLLHKLGVNLLNIKDYIIQFAIQTEHKEALNLLLDEKSSFEKTDRRVISQYFGSPFDALTRIDESTHPHLCYLLVKRRISNSKLPFLTLLSESPSWLKPYFMIVMSEGL